MKTGYHAVYARDFFDGIDDAGKYGFNFVQFDLGVPAFFLNNLDTRQLIAVRDYAKDRNVEITFHSPGDNVSLFCDYPIIRKGILDEFRLILDKANVLNARHVTFHAGIYPSFKKSASETYDLNTAYYEEVFYDNMKCLTDDCGDVLVCIENYQLCDNTRRAIKKLIDGGHPLYLTLDTAKLYNRDFVINKDDKDFYVQYRDYIRELHIHDMNREFGSHQVVGTGMVDFMFFRQFVNSNVYANFEVRPVGAAKQSKDVLARMWKTY